jgi:hypothetical protein
VFVVLVWNRSGFFEDLAVFRYLPCFYRDELFDGLLAGLCAVCYEAVLALEVGISWMAFGIFFDLGCTFGIALRTYITSEASQFDMYFDFGFDLENTILRRKMMTEICGMNNV